MQRGARSRALRRPMPLSRITIDTHPRALLGSIGAGFRPLSLRFWLASAEAERVPGGAKEGGEGWNQKLAACRHGVRVFPQHTDNIRRRNPSANPIYRDEAYSPIRRLLTDLGQRSVA